jgi:hypothetical protein
MARIPVRLVISLVLLGAGGCDESTTLVLDPNPAVRVEIDASRCPTISKCGSCILETDAFDKYSQPEPFPTLHWTSGNENIATVEARPEGEARVNGWTTGGTSISVEVMETGATDNVGVTVVSSMINCQRPGADRNAALSRGKPAS